LLSGDGPRRDVAGQGDHIAARRQALARGVLEGDRDRRTAAGGDRAGTALIVEVAAERRPGADHDRHAAHEGHAVEGAAQHHGPGHRARERRAERAVAIVRDRAQRARLARQRERRAARDAALPCASLKAMVIVELPSVVIEVGRP